MDIEMSLKAVLLKATQDFKDKVNSINSDIKNLTEEFITEARDAADAFNQELSKQAIEYQA